jgi:hypothetical protein
MSKYTIRLNTTNWYCECCGSGVAFCITLFDPDGQYLWSTSRDDQFGGTMNEADEDLDLHTWENFIQGMQKALELAGHEVYLETNIDQTDPYDNHSYLDEDEE